MLTPAPGPSGWAVVRRLLGFLRPYRRDLALSAFCGLATISASVGLMSTSAYLISAAALHPSIAELEVAIVAVRAFGLSRAVFRYLERLLSHSVNLGLLAQLRTWLFEKIEPLVPARTQDYRSGDLLTRMVSDVDTLEDFYVRALLPLAEAALVCVGMLIFLGFFHYSLALAIAAAMLTIGLALPVGARSLGRSAGRALVETRAALNAALVDGVQGCADLLAFGGETAHVERLKGLNRRLAQDQLHMAWLDGLHTGLAGLFSNLGMWAVLALGILLVSTGQMEGVNLAVVTLGAIASFEVVLPIPLAAQHIESSLQAARRLFRIADTLPAVPEPTVSTTLPAASTESTHLCVRNLSFTYPGTDHPALNDISFELGPGSRLAIVGPSGSGKSTLVGLIERFWLPDAGEITLGGVDLRSLDGESLRRRIGCLGQSTVLFNQTVRQNLLLANPEASREETESAARRAQIHERILALPDGYDTWIGERGLHLSVGERQRLAVARLLIQDPPILLLDEPTASLDPLNEASLMQTLIREVFPGRSVLLISHRPTGLDCMDEIIALKQGRVVERGSHTALLAARGYYWKMAALTC